MRLYFYILLHTVYDIIIAGSCPLCNHDEENYVPNLRYGLCVGIAALFSVLSFAQAPQAEADRKAGERMPGIAGQRFGSTTPRCPGPTSLVSVFP